MKRILILAALLTFCCLSCFAAEDNPKPGDLLELTIKNVKFRFRWCPPGTFTMGSPASEEFHDSRENQYPATLSKGFWMQETEVSQEQWAAVSDTASGGDNKESPHFKGAKLPVESVSWDDCQKFIEKLNNSGGTTVPRGFKFALPTEAQWEYACRGGSKTVFCFGDEVGKLGDYAWQRQNSEEKTHPVGTKKPNGWNLYDMHGNVWEWCADWFGDYPSGAAADPKGGKTGEYRVNRGGSWENTGAVYCRSANRNSSTPAARFKFLGMRLALVNANQ